VSEFPFLHLLNLNFATAGEDRQWQGDKISTTEGARVAFRADSATNSDRRTNLEGGECGASGIFAIAFMNFVKSFH
jgi:hypothetical protein